MVKYNLLLNAISNLIANEESIKVKAIILIQIALTNPVLLIVNPLAKKPYRRNNWL
jgi:hypothetical protein